MKKASNSGYNSFTQKPKLSETDIPYITSMDDGKTTGNGRHKGALRSLLFFSMQVYTVYICCFLVFLALSLFEAPKYFFVVALLVEFVGLVVFETTCSSNVRNLIGKRRLESTLVRVKMNDLKDIAAALRDQMDGLSDADFAWFLEVGRQERISPGQALIYENQALESFYLILEGEFEIATKSKEFVSEDIPILTVDAGIIGEMTFLRRRRKSYRPSATVKAHKESLVWSIPISSLEQKVDSDSGFGVRFYEVIGGIVSDRLEASNRYKASRKGLTNFLRRFLHRSKVSGLSSYAPPRTLGGVLYAIDSSPNIADSSSTGAT